MRLVAIVLGLLAAAGLAVGNLTFVSAPAQPAALTKSQSDALETYRKAVDNFRSILGQRRAQVSSKQQLPNLPGQALYLARNSMMSAYKDLTDALPSKIGRPNKFGIPPAYFDADNEPLIDEYLELFSIMQAPPANVQNSDTPFDDVVALGTIIGRAKGLDAKDAEAAGRISLGMFFAETNGIQNIGNARSNKYKGSFQTGVPEDQNGQRKWAAIRTAIAAFDPRLAARDDKEEARIGNLDQRLDHWTAVRNGLMNAHADLFPQIPAIARLLPNPIDQMSFLSSSRSFPARPGPLSDRATSPPIGFPIQRSWAFCATTACSRLERPTGRRHRQPTPKFSKRCGSSMRNSNKRCPNSTRSRLSQRGKS